MDLNLRASSFVAPRFRHFFGIVICGLGLTLASGAFVSLTGQTTQTNCRNLLGTLSCQSTVMPTPGAEYDGLIAALLGAAKTYRNAKELEQSRNAQAVAQPAILERLSVRNDADLEQRRAQFSVFSTKARPFMIALYDTLRLGAGTGAVYWGEAQLALDNLFIANPNAQSRDIADLLAAVAAPYRGKHAEFVRRFNAVVERISAVRRYTPAQKAQFTKVAATAIDPLYQRNINASEGDISDVLVLWAL